jgi:uncharacterized lipoprotein YbaY
MKRPTDRRTVLITAGAAAFAAATGTAAAQSVDIQGAVSFAGEAVIPEGQIEVYLEDLAIQDSGQRRIAEARIKSDGGTRMIGFALSRPAGLPLPATLQVVARLERKDGWLIARGSAPFEPGLPVNITLKKAIY